MTRTLVTLREAALSDALFLVGLWQDSIRIADKQEQLADLEVVIKTAAPHPLLPTELSTIAILSAKQNGAGAVAFDRQECKGVGTYPKTEAFNSGEAAIGTGPYKLVRYTKGDRVILERNEAYWGEKPAWQRVIFRPITSAGPRVAATRVTRRT